MRKRVNHKYDKCPIFGSHIEGAPFQPGERVRVVQAIDTEVYDVSPHIGKRGHVRYLEYDCGCGQTYPDDPMVGVVLKDGSYVEFWKDELISEERVV